MKINKLEESLKKLKEEMGTRYSSDGSVLLQASNDKDFEISKEATVIGSCAFENCDKIEIIEIPSNIELIKNYAFYGCKRLKKIVIPANTKVSKNTFGGCNPIIIDYKGDAASWDDMDVSIPRSTKVLFARDKGIISLRTY